MEYALGALKVFNIDWPMSCLNPYSNGICSRSFTDFDGNFHPKGS